MEPPPGRIGRALPVLPGENQVSNCYLTTLLSNTITKLDMPGIWFDLFAEIR